ncbi:MAG: 4'-phosphopantetheinyl transferase superfamily protein [Tannerellaceae bacterium]|jgi:phosphopantetheinyl transferase|nr:4'-phosphopantetheinyl transferase superfamily protein [Tannerellaceae bacterium]
MALFLRHTGPLRGVWKIEESPDELLSRLTLPANRLLPMEMHGVNRIREWLAVRVLLKELLGEELLIAYDPNGAPYLPDRRIHIGISHTKGYAAVVLSEQHPVSIDIEYPNDRVRRVRRRFMNPEEEAMIDPAHEAEHLLLCWCAKETLYKIIGRREVDILRHLHLAPFAFGPSGSLVATEMRTPARASYMLDYMFNKYFAMTWSREITAVSTPSLLNSAMMVLLLLIR